jgi:hypothetical protein
MNRMTSITTGGLRAQPFVGQVFNLSGQGAILSYEVRALLEH